MMNKDLITASRHLNICLCSFIISVCSINVWFYYKCDPVVLKCLIFLWIQREMDEKEIIY